MYVTLFVPDVSHFLSQCFACRMNVRYVILITTQYSIRLVN